MNYLVLRALKRTYSVRGAYAERCGDVYRRLRENVIGNVMKQVGEDVTVLQSIKRLGSSGRTTTRLREKERAFIPSLDGRRCSCLLWVNNMIGVFVGIQDVISFRLFYNTGKQT